MHMLVLMESMWMHVNLVLVHIHVLIRGLLQLTPKTEVWGEMSKGHFNIKFKGTSHGEQS